MAMKDDVRTRAPRGTKNVTQAFFEALDGVPGSQQKAVATAALAGIRDELRAKRLKAKEAAGKAKAKAPARKPATPAGKSKPAAATRRATAAVGRQTAVKKTATKKPAARKAPAKLATSPNPGRAKASGKIVTPASDATSE
jgi:hypothetical protein